MTAEHRVYGPPGTGKTTYLSGQARRAADKHGAQNVVIASLTRTAAEEVAGRDTGIPPRNVATLHAHAFRALDHPRIADEPAGFVEWNQHIGAGPLQIQNHLGAGTAMDAPPAEALGYASDGEILLGEYGIERNRMSDRETWPARLREFAARWEEWKRESGRIDFTDMIEAALREVDELPGQPQVLMLDEAQDLSKLEMSLARKWGEKAEHFVVVGDPDQNLYEWRGSDPAAFAATEAASEHVLSQSYRVPRAVHDYAVRWIEKIEDRAPVDYLPRDFEGDVRLERHTWTRPEALVKQAVGQIEEGRSVMFLTSCAFMLEPLIRVLREQGVPFHNPYRVKQGAWNPMRSANRLHSYLAPGIDDGSLVALSHAFGSGLWTWGQMKAWTEPLLATGVFARGAKSRMEERCQKDRFGESDADIIPTREETEALFAEGMLEVAESFDLKWWESKLRAKKKTANAYPLAVVKRRGVEALTATPSCVVGTIHSVKGGEADCVYVFPDISRRGAAEARDKGEGRKAAIRQFYVAFTRAREELYICRPDGEHYLVLPEP